MHRPVVAVRITAIGVGTVFTLLLYAVGVQLESPVRQLVALIPAVAALLLLLWDIWLWRLPGVMLLHKRPDIRGLWSVSLKPTNESHIPEGGNRGPIPAYAIVQQSFWSISVRQYTRESTSISRTFFWQGTPGADTERLAFIYENNPEQAYQHRSFPHTGNCLFDVASRKPKRMSGEYFTARYTKGDMKLILVDRTKGYADFAEADDYAKTKEGVDDA